jgi:hypothetical protein
MIFYPVSNAGMPKGMRAWAARSHGYSFVITHEPLRGEPEYHGYTASWKNIAYDMHPFGAQRANKIDGGPWETFTTAVSVCNATLKALVKQQ